MNDQTRPTGTAVALHLPNDARELRDLATFISTSRLIPSHFQKSPADCWMVMDFCREKRLNFFATIGHCSIVRNNLFFDGQLCGALLNISDFLAGQLNHEIEHDKDGNAVAVITSARLRNETTPRAVRVELAKVKTDAKVWISQPEQQLCYSGNRIWGRRHLPEVLLGMKFEGETIDVTPNEIITHNAQAPAMPARDRAHTPIGNVAGEDSGPDVAPEATATSLDQRTIPEHRSAAEQEASQPFEITRADDSRETWSAWTKLFLAYVRSAPTADLVNEWTYANAENLAALAKQYPENYQTLVEKVNGVIEEKTAPP